MEHVASRIVPPHQPCLHLVQSLGVGRIVDQIRRLRGITFEIVEFIQIMRSEHILPQIGGNHTPTAVTLDLAATLAIDAVRPIFWCERYEAGAIEAIQRLRLTPIARKSASDPSAGQIQGRQCGFRRVLSPASRYETPHHAWCSISQSVFDWRPHHFGRL